MAISFTNLTMGGSSAGTSSYNTASVTVTADNVCLLSTASHLVTGNGPVSVTSVTGGGVTWTFVIGLNWGQAVGTGKANRSEIWLGVGGSPSAGVLTITWSTSPATCSWSVDQSTGAGTTQAAAIGISATNNADVATASPLTVTMGTFNFATSGTFGYGASDNSGTGTGQGAGFIELAHATTVAPSTATEYAATNVSPVTTTYGGAAVRWGIIGLEIMVPSIAPVTPVSDDYWTNMLASTFDTIVTVWG